MDGMFCVFRVAKNDSWIVAWWFSEMTIGGRLVLERYCEYTAIEHDDRVLSSYVMTKELSHRDHEFSGKEIIIPPDVIKEAAKKTTRELRPGIRF